MRRAAALTVRDVSVERGGRVVLSNLSFQVPAGVALVVTGDNGSGKSTLLRAIAGLLPLSVGSIGLQPSPGDAELSIAECTHYLGHANGLKLALSAADNLAFQRAWLGGRGLSVSEALDAVGLAHVAAFPVSILSAGQKRRVALARLLVSTQPLWLLDEPATAIDTRSEALLAELIRAHLATGGLVVAAVHSTLAIEAQSLRLGR